MSTMGTHTHSGIQRNVYSTQTVTTGPTVPQTCICMPMQIQSRIVREEPHITQVHGFMYARHIHTVTEHTQALRRRWSYEPSTITYKRACRGALAQIPTVIQTCRSTVGPTHIHMSTYLSVETQTRTVSQQPYAITHRIISDPQVSTQVQTSTCTDTYTYTHIQTHIRTIETTATMKAELAPSWKADSILKLIHQLNFWMNEPAPLTSLPFPGWTLECTQRFQANDGISITLTSEARCLRC